MMYVFFKFILGPLILLFLRPVVYGRENLRVQGKAIFVSNHISMADPMLLALISPRIIHFMAKKEIFKSRLGNLFFRAMLAFPVNRRNADLQSLRIALKVLDKGKVFGIFPEGKRAITEELDEFEKGAAFLAVRSGAPLVPMYIHPGSYRSLHPRVIVGSPIQINSLSAGANKSSLIDVVTDEIADAVSALKEDMEMSFDNTNR